MTTTNKTAAHIAELLHLTRSTSWTSDSALELSAAMRDQSAETLAMALITYTTGLLRASRGVVELQLGCQQSQAARDEGLLQ